MTIATKANARTTRLKLASANAAVVLAQPKQSSAGIRAQVMAEGLARERAVCELEGRAFEPLPTTEQQIERLRLDIVHALNGLEFPLDLERHIQRVLLQRCSAAGIQPDPEWQCRVDMLTQTLTAAQGHLRAAEQVLKEVRAGGD